jgi:sec-independent protein translocase protein TatC
VAKRIKPVGYDDRLSIVDHLDELRTRIIISLVAVGAATALCAWQNHLVLDIANNPLDGREPVTLSPTEPFLTTLTLALYAGILLALPIVLYEIYAFVLPAFSPPERRVALPLLLLVPFLFIGGVLFGYFVVLPPGIDFLLGFNADEFDTELRARDYYSFVALFLVSLGLLFQIPVGILAATKLGLTTPEKLRRGRRYAILVMAVLAAMLPTIDPVTMIIEMVPLLVLYELSILLASAFGRPSAEVSERLASAEGS